MGWDFTLSRPDGSEHTYRWAPFWTKELFDGQHPPLLTFETGAKQDTPRLRLHRLACSLEGDTDRVVSHVFGIACELRDAMKRDPSLRLEVS